MSALSQLSCVSLQPSPIKKDRSPRPQSFCHSSSLSPHDKLSLPGFISQRDKQQRLSYSAFTNQMYSASTDLTSSPVADGPPLPPRNQGKGQTCPAPSASIFGQQPQFLQFLAYNQWQPVNSVDFVMLIHLLQMSVCNANGLKVACMLHYVWLLSREDKSLKLSFIVSVNVWW